MAQVTYDKQLTALLVIDRYNDFISEGGKVWNRIGVLRKRMTAFLTCFRLSMITETRAAVIT